MYRREVEAARQDLQHLFTVVSNAAARAAQRERRTDDDREANLAGKVESVFQIVCQCGLRNVEADLLHRIFEEQPVFSLLDRSQLRADELNIVFFEDAGIGEFHREVERSLSTHGRKQSEAAFAAA